MFQAPPASGGGDVIGQLQGVGDSLAVLDGRAANGQGVEAKRRAAVDPHRLVEIAFDPRAGVAHLGELCVNDRRIVIVRLLIDVIRGIDGEEDKPGVGGGVDVGGRLEMVGVRAPGLVITRTGQRGRGGGHDLRGCAAGACHLTDRLLCEDASDAPALILKSGQVAGRGAAEAVAETKAGGNAQWPGAGGVIDDGAGHRHVFSGSL